MLEILKNYSLKNNTTFGVDIACHWFAEPKSTAELAYIIQYAADRSWLVTTIGEGSNLLFIQTYEGLIIHPTIRGIDKVDDSNAEVLLRVGAGENWDEFVAYCVKNNWYGTENLSLIPGSVGATPVQNIGAYGVEAKDIIDAVEVYDKETKSTEIFSNKACEFGYRDSIFKHRLNERFVVTHVIFRLKKNGELNLNYGNVKEEFFKTKDKSLQGLRNTIISIRERKLPKPTEVGNAGSYFKNPTIKKESYLELASKYENIPGFPMEKNEVKVPAAWLIEFAGWKGVREGSTGCWPNQPLVIVNYGNATGKEIFNFSEKIRESVKEKFGINLEREVTIVPPS